MSTRAKQPRWEVADVIRRFGEAFRAQGGVCKHHLRTLSALERCRTAALGGHIDACTECGAVRISYNSCRNRHCPKCGGLQRELWIQARSEELLPVKYYHVVFTIPEQFNEWCLYNPAFCYDTLFKAAWQTLRTFAADDKWLGAQAGATMVLHTWGQNLSLHPHIHCIVPGGGIAPQGQWQNPKRAGSRGFLFPVKAMSKVFRAIYLRHFTDAYKQGSLHIPPRQKKPFAQWRRERFAQHWVVYAKAPFHGPQAVVEYLGRYTHKVAISNHRITNIDKQRVSFRYKDYRQDGKRKTMSLEGAEFLRRFCLHILPPGFRRMRHYGILSNFHKARALHAARIALKVEPAQPTQKPEAAEQREKVLEQWLGRNPYDCPHCGAKASIQRVAIIPACCRDPPPVAMQVAKFI